MADELVQVLGPAVIRTTGAIKRVEVRTHPGGRFTGKKHYRGIDHKGYVAFEVAAPDTDPGRKAARSWIREHGITTKKWVYTRG